MLGTSCSNTKYLAKGQTLYLGSTVKVIDSANKEKAYLEEILSEAIRPKRNKKIFGVRFKLTMYNLAGEPKSEKGLRKYVRDKIGEAPVLGESFNLKRNEQIIINMLQNNGYFGPQIVSTRIDDTLKKTTTGKFEVRAGKRYYFRKVEYLTGDTVLVAKEIQGIAAQSLLKRGNPYLLDAIMADRDRIDDHLKNMGYYYFSPDFLIAKIDTGTGTDSIDLRMELKYDVMQPKTYQQYRIKDVYLNTNYIAQTTNDTTRRRRTNLDTVTYEHYHVIRRRENFKPVIFKTAIHLKPGDLYSKKKQNLSLNRLVSLNAFKFIKSDLTDIYDSTGQPLLTALYNLTPYPSKSLNFEAAGFSQNDSRVGSRLSVGWKHKNIFKGAEQLEIKVSGGFEIQYGGSQKLPNLYQTGIETNLSVPRLLFGRTFNLSTNSAFIPRSYVKLAYNYYLRQTAYRLNTFNFSLGYQWKESINKDHKLYPINITYVKTDTFKDASNFYIDNILFNGIIIGPTYQFTYNSQIGGRKDVNFFFDGLVDLSANILGLAQKTSLSKPPEKILGTQYAQYIKMQTDFRVYKTFGKENMWANRLFLGAGYAYGNSYKMPNIKQFFVGGANSLRGFRSRFLGPGSFHGSSTGTNYLELLGDIKIEANTEFRVPLYSTWLKGAAFIDAGNVWMLRDDPNFPGGMFSKNFIKDIAVSGGLGLRMDFSILVLRFDFGMPMRKPWLADGDKWVLNQIDFTSKAWRKDNLIFNLAIGYPF
ncbi:hypothetical protein DBR32_00775 [Taibaiella sp. KBW10]|nr:hypothetical protein DBR32_00775 [Taibaiella sp. KBW10]